MEPERMKMQDEAAAEVVAAIDEWIRMNGHVRTDAWQRMLLYTVETFGYASLVRFVGLAAETPQELQLGAELIRIDRRTTAETLGGATDIKTEPGWIARLRTVYAQKNGTQFPEVN